MLPSKEDKITIKVEGQSHNKSLQLTLNWDADIDDWVEAFKTILIHQTFSEDSVKELFEYPLQEYETVSWRNEPNINKVSCVADCGTVGKEVW